MHKILLLIFLLFVGPVQAAGTLFQIEQSDLKTLPDGALSAIRASKPNDKEFSSCSFSGAPINLVSFETSKYWGSTTEHGCYCGAAICPLLILKEENNVWSVLLSYGGFYIKKLPKQKQGLPDLLVGTATAARIEESTWQFNGKQYVRKAR